MKLFLAPKNITGKEKKTEIKKPPFINKYKPSLISFRSKFIRKLPFVSFPYLHDPIFPTKI